MTKREIDRLGIKIYSLLLVGVVNGSIKETVGPAMDRGNLAVIIPFVVVNLPAAILTLQSILFFIGHLFTENNRVKGGGKALWLALLILGNLVAMPVYWYWYIVRERIGETAASASELFKVT